MTVHSSLVGGSSADRIINCPGSYQATLALPASANRSSEYAEEGTAMHKVMDRLMHMRKSYAFIASFNPFVEASYLVGQRFHDRVLTQEHVDTMISPALVQLRALEDAYGGGFHVLGVEMEVAFPGIPGAFGTCDVIMGNGYDTVLHVDWKFGQGVAVKALYSDVHGERVNAQLMFYVAAAMNSARGLYRGYGRRFTPVVAIIQPRTDPPLSHVAISRVEVKWFAEDLQEAVARATGRDPPRLKGEHCRWAPCKINCPLWTGPLLELAELSGAPTTPTPPSEVSKSGLSVITPYGAYLSRAKALVDIVAMFGKEVDAQLHAYLEEGGLVPGWRLKAKTKQRQWIDEDAVVSELFRLGFREGEVWQKKLQTFASADATAKRLGVEIPKHLRAAPPSNETTIATTDDPAPIVDRVKAMSDMRDALKQLVSPSRG